MGIHLRFVGQEQNDDGAQSSHAGQRHHELRKASHLHHRPKQVNRNRAETKLNGNSRTTYT